MQNILAGGIENVLETTTKQLVSDDLDIIPPHLRMQCVLTNLVRMIDKEINPRGDYIKGHGDHFWHYMNTYHQGATFLPIIRVMGGARQDGSFEASLPLYVGFMLKRGGEYTSN